MKKLFSILLVLLLIINCAFSVSGVEGTVTEYNKKTDKMFIRDPFVLVYEGKYYMYGTGAATAPGYGCYVSEDLENWAGPYNVFTASQAEGFSGIGDYWAPECHYYNGSFYLFASYKSSTTGHRGTSVFKASSPLGPFVEISDGHITPKNQDSIDGTLYVDENNQPWIVYVDEWTSTADGNGTMSAAKLSDDLSATVSSPVMLFKSISPYWSTKNVTDGPFLYRTSCGELIMIWSNIIKDYGYSVGVAKSSNGKVDGKWKHDMFPLYTESESFTYDGGHGMIFTDLEGRLMMAIHSPNGKEGVLTHAVFIELTDTGDTVILKENSQIKNLSFKERFVMFFKFLFNKISYFFKHLFK